MSGDSLKDYQRRRDFRSTSEPDDSQPDLAWADDRPIFVIQKHDASNLHYDFRLEVDDTLKSWAVPKGLSTDPGDKRLAMPTEDHPLGYANFEGVIPEDQYGGGTVMIWDRGSYENAKALEADDEDDVPSVAEQLEQGHAVVYLHGEKLTGAYALIRTSSGDDERWLVVKTDDDQADARRSPTSTQPDSAVTGRSLQEIADQQVDQENDD